MVYHKVSSVTVEDSRGGHEYDVRVHLQAPGSAGTVILSPAAARELRDKLGNLGSSITAYRRRKATRE